LSDERSRAAYDASQGFYDARRPPESRFSSTDFAKPPGGHTGGHRGAGVGHMTEGQVGSVLRHYPGASVEVGANGIDVHIQF